MSATTLAIAIGIVGVAQATTGTTPLAHPPRFSVTRAQAAPYMGRFVLVKQPHSPLISGAYVGGRNDRGFVEGGLAIYKYGARGEELNWVGRTYEYHYVRGGMTIDVISAANEQLFARLRLSVAKNGSLVGALRELLPVPHKWTKIVLRPKH